MGLADGPPWLKAHLSAGLDFVAEDERALHRILAQSTVQRVQLASGASLLIDDGPSRTVDELFHQACAHATAS
jgi:hypothetical protein